MNSQITNRVMTRTLRHHCKQFLSRQYDINKSSSAYHTVNFRQKNEYRNHHFSLSQNLPQKSLLFASTPMHLSFQRNFASEIKDFEKMFNTAVTTTKELIPADEAAKIASSALPEFIRNVADWKIVHLAQNTLLNMHDMTGLPWWASITLSAIMARAVITLPFSLIQVFLTTFWMFVYFFKLSQQSIFFYFKIWLKVHEYFRYIMQENYNLFSQSWSTL